METACFHWTVYQAKRSVVQCFHWTTSHIPSKEKVEAVQIIPGLFHFHSDTPTMAASVIRQLRAKAPFFSWATFIYMGHCPYTSWHCVKWSLLGRSSGVPTTGSSVISYWTGFIWISYDIIIILISLGVCSQESPQFKSREKDARWLGHRGLTSTWKYPITWSDYKLKGGNLQQACCRLRAKLNSTTAA